MKKSAETRRKGEPKGSGTGEEGRGGNGRRKVNIDVGKRININSVRGNEKYGKRYKMKKKITGRKQNENKIHTD